MLPAPIRLNCLFRSVPLRSTNLEMRLMVRIPVLDSSLGAGALFTRCDRLFILW